MKTELHPYQGDAVEAVDVELEKHRSTLVVMPTGTGKTVTFAAIAERWRPRGRILVVAHREELIDQAADKIERFTDLKCAIEMGDRRVQPDLFGLPDVVVASVQTLSRPNRRAVFVRDTFALVIVDEAHHSASDQYLEVLDYFSVAKVLGVTATPDRADERGLGVAFESVAYVYEIRDAIEQGFLVPIRQTSVQIESLELAGCRVSRDSGDLSDQDLESVLMDERVLHEMAVPTIELSGQRPTIVFTASVAHAHALAEVLNRYKPGSAAGIDGTSMKRDARRATLEAAAGGQIQYLTNCAVLTEGYDNPPISCVVMARPTTSRALYTQCVGRGTRLSPETGKRDLLVLHLVGNAGRHALVSAVDILDGGKTDKEARQLALKMIAEEPEMPIHEAIDRAAEELAKKRREAQIIVRARYKTADIDPFTVLGAPNAAGRWNGAPPTPKQIEVLAKAGITVDPAKMDRGQCSALITKVGERRAHGLCTFKQAKMLAKYGLNPDVQFHDARRAMDAIAANGWRVPESLKNDPTFRAARAEVA